jgi:hypothetical protein
MAKQPRQNNLSQFLTQRKAEASAKSALAFIRRLQVLIDKENKLMKRCCDLVYWKHEDGWDVYHRSECQQINGAWVPNWFDNFVIEDAPTKAAAKAEIASRHLLGMCLVSA